MCLQLFMSISMNFNCFAIFSLLPNNRRPSRNKRYIINSWPGLWSSESYEILITSPRGPYIYRAVIFFHLKGRTSCDLPCETDGRLAFNTGHDIRKLYFVIYVYKKHHSMSCFDRGGKKKNLHKPEEDLT